MHIRPAWCWGNWIVGVSFDADALMRAAHGTWMVIIHVFCFSLIFEGTRPSIQVLEANLHCGVLGDYKRALGRTFIVNWVEGYIGEDSVEAKGPATVKVLHTSPSDLNTLNDGWHDPCWDVRVLQGAPEVLALRSPYIYAPSYHAVTGDRDGGGVILRRETWRDRLHRWTRRNPKVPNE